MVTKQTCPLLLSSFTPQKVEVPFPACQATKSQAQVKTKAETGGMEA